MAEKKQDFVVSDRRRFGAEGELRSDVATHEEEEQTETTSLAPASSITAPPAENTPPAEEKKAPTPAASPAGVASASAGGTQTSGAAQHEAEEDYPEPPSATEMQEQKDAYHASGKKIDDLISKQGVGRATLPEMTFERLIESFYMTALLQMGAIRQEGETPAVDIMGARQTIDSLTMIQEKTKGNLSEREQTFLQNVLFELRMAWIEITNALASAKPGAAPGTLHEKK